MKKWTIVGNEGGDWEGLYIDGKLVAEGHSIQLRDVAAALDVDFESIEVSDGWMEEVSSNMPKRLKDVPR